MERVAKEITDVNPMTAGNGGLMRIAAGVFLLKHINTTDDFTIMNTASQPATYILILILKRVVSYFYFYLMQ